MFEWVGLTGAAADQGRMIAAQLAGLSEEMFVEHIKSFESRGVVVKRGNYVQVQPLPLAAQLAARRWEMLPDTKILTFFARAPEPLKESLLRRTRWLDTLPQAREFAATLLKPSSFGNLQL